MIELSLNKVVKSFGFKRVLEEFDLELKTGERVALIGPNGSGKTTIFKMITGEETSTSGMISVRKGATLGMLSQIPKVYSDDITVLDVLKSGKQQIYDIEKRLRDTEAKLSTSTPDKLDSILKTYGKLQELFENIGGYLLETNLSKVCNGFKIGEEMLTRKYNTLSGGEKTIVNFATLILSEPSILLLDEPTNHIDIDTREMLEEALNEYNGTILFVSHDRYFIDKVSQTTFEIEDEKITEYIGNYSDLKEQKKKVLEIGTKPKGR